MLSYNLAKELKDAGFPKQYEERWLVYNHGHSITESCPRCGTKEGTVFVPTLSELIEACGEEFYSLTYWTKNEVKDWEAASSTEDGLRKVYGATPTEAVARLLISLYNQGNGKTHTNKKPD